MAIVNKGFPGTVNATEYAKSWNLGGSDACKNGGWLVTQGTGRQTSTAAGDAFASGVLSENSAPILTSLSTPTNGQWFLIVRRIDWAGAGTVSVAAVAHSTTTTTVPTVAPTTFPTINNSPGVLYDQKLAWAWVRSTDTTMVLFDLREQPLEPRLQVIETTGAARSTGAVWPTATPATLDAIDNAVIGDIAQILLPGTGIDPLPVQAVAGSGSTIDWRIRDRIYATTKANLDTATTTLTGISDILLRVGDRAYAADTTFEYRWDGSAWQIDVGPVFHVGRGFTQALGAGSWTLVNGAYGTPGLNTGFTSFASGVLTVAHSGWYRPTVNVKFPTAANPIAAQLTVNSTSVDTAATVVSDFKASAAAISMSGLVYLTATDTVRLYLFSASAQNIGTNPRDLAFSAEWVRP